MNRYSENSQYLFNTLISRENDFTLKNVRAIIFKLFLSPIFFRNIIAFFDSVRQDPFISNRILRAFEFNMREQERNITGTAFGGSADPYGLLSTAGALNRIVIALNGRLH